MRFVSALIISWLAVSSPVAANDKFGFSEVDFFMGKFWFVFKTDLAKSSNRITFRAYAGMSDPKRGEMVGKVVNFLNYHCDRSGSAFTIGLPDLVALDAVDKIRFGEAVRLSITNDNDQKTTFLARKNTKNPKGDKELYLDNNGNKDVIDRIYLSFWANTIVEISSRGGSGTTRFVHEEAFDDAIIGIINQQGLEFTSFTDDEMKRRCAEHLLNARIKN